jgi:hypothetical protein
MSHPMEAQEAWKILFESETVIKNFAIKLC